MSHDPAFDEFITRLAQMIFHGDITPRDIYDTMMEVNDNDHVLSMEIKEKAMATAKSMRMAVAARIN